MEKDINDAIIFCVQNNFFLFLLNACKVIQNFDKNFMGKMFAFNKSLFK